MNRFLTMLLLLVGAAVLYTGSVAEAALSIRVGARGPLPPPPPPPRRCCRPCPPPPCYRRAVLPHRHHRRAPRRCYNYTRSF